MLGQVVLNLRRGLIKDDCVRICLRQPNRELGFLAAKKLLPDPTQLLCKSAHILKRSFPE
jgi:hypothetical protein